MKSSAHSNESGFCRHGRIWLQYHHGSVVSGDVGDLLNATAVQQGSLAMVVENVVRTDSLFVNW